MDHNVFLVFIYQDFNAKLSDFGLAKFGPVNGISHVTTRVMGTYGYAAPEYMATGTMQFASPLFSHKDIVMCVFVVACASVSVCVHFSLCVQVCV